ncbi:Phospho-N-acetylmuramoyl-pentapeptide-transferase [Chlamydia avium]|uniref:Phospho-N-acetylmuramoyl-pentapeptide-transferase n=1 Tax=Chlamydia avium TaxID=1457141 RepID=A0ABN0MSM0_9CHLA|nr:phospho-N-acetylmuramoyl-pentapeptide-transferase [Chlamydia avium]EPP37030.1 phospho-N-acetylmuramoyl-pentapeptide-transferase [Chlamydia psittaci 10_743_SC13]EPP38480.1 phospho-N-acetylmuramoyl-pentapeptide-transferase [Chlamydia avium]VVT43091.1 Phospho-N-acetylmuramoyl-pentapeptide-transferase [Chlamydia avium]
MFSCFHDAPYLFLTLVFCVALAQGWILGHPVIHWLRRQNHYNQLQKAHCEKLEALHCDKASTPTAGGILFIIVLLTAVILWLPLRNPITWLSLFLIVSWGGLGWYDDIVKKRKKKGHGITVQQKFIIQFLIAAVTVVIVLYTYDEPSKFYTLNVPFYGTVSLGSSFLEKFLCFILAILAIVGTSNAVNLTDGLDGLASGTVSMAALSCLVIAILHITTPLAINIAVILTALIGVCLAFLKYNLPPAKVFMGDTGSLLIGGILGSCAVMLRAELFLILCGGVFVAEAGSVILQVMSWRLRKKRIFFCSPLHHHYEYQGVEEKIVVRNFWIAGFFCMILGIAAAILGK